MKKYIFPIIITLGALAAYLNSFYCEWHLDDFHAIVDFDYDATNLWNLFLLRKQRALGFATFFLNYKLCGYNNLPCWHLVNLLIHTVNSLLLYLIALRLFIREEVARAHPQAKLFGEYTALVIALIFAVHPLQTSAVTYVTQRIELLGAFFIFLSFYFFLLILSAKNTYRKITFALCLSAAIALGGLTKETIVVAPLLMGAYFVIVKLKCWKKRIIVILCASCAALIIAAGALIMFKALTFSPAPHLTLKPFEVLWRDAAQSPAVYYSTQPRVLSRFLRLCVFPYGQCVEYWMQPSASFVEWRACASFALHLTIIIFALAIWRKRPFFLFGIFWLYICLLPSSILPNGIFEHRIYAALAGLLIAVFIPIGYELLNLPLRTRKSVGILSVCLAGMLILCFIFMSHLRNKTWKSEYSLWRECAALAPNNWRANVNYGYALLNRGELQKAKYYLEKSFAQKSNVWAVANNLGLLYSYLNDIDGSIKMFEYGLKLKPRNRLLKANLGACYLEKGLINKGTNLLYSARTRESIITLGNYFLKKRKYKEALKCYDRVLKKYPNDADALAGKAACQKALMITIENQSLRSD